MSAIARQLNPRTFEFVANQPLDPGQELEVQIAFPTDILNVPKPRWQQINFLGIVLRFYFPESLEEDNGLHPTATTAPTIPSMSKRFRQSQKAMKVVAVVVVVVNVPRSNS